MEYTGQCIWSDIAYMCSMIIIVFVEYRNHRCDERQYNAECSSSLHSHVKFEHEENLIKLHNFK